MRHIRQHMQAVAATIAMGVVVSGCATDTGTAADAFTARVVINDQEMPTTYSVQCSQQGWFWTIETLPPAPGFTAIVQTGGTVTPEVMRIQDLAGFTGSSSEEATDTQASIDGTTFHMSGTAHGSFADRPTKAAEVRYRMEARC
ncbi:lipoprotein LpqH [Mycolicibacterium sp. HK-90]|uniref:lipoprotein LpqH n=1 Tax=Mycolicibacterium sp. HK-90 TaxID=3056937 RepID=UPI002659237D|nr:lipoprotein LpqH [Mycolicibacterium sp. HK-90]WKG06297.1 lipoprotein LpqH [Mycolicibacterium sp. HK-90]